MSKLDLADDATPEAVRSFASGRIGLAYEDHRAGYPEMKRTGDWLVRHFCRKWRGIHKRMATGIYNNARTTFRNNGKD